MRIPALLCSVLFAVPAFAQLQLFQFDGVNETPVTALVDLGSSTTGDTVELRFHMRNTGAGAAIFQTLSLAGAGFTISLAPSLPYTVAPGSFAEFRVKFQPTATGTYSAFLLANSINLILRGTAVPGGILTLANSAAPIASGATIDFGSLVRGSSRLQTLTISNPNSSAITIGALTVTGTGFRGPIGATAPIQLAANQSIMFQVAFEPLSGQPLQGTLLLDKRSFVLTGQGLDPPLPAASVLIATKAGASAQQNSVSIPLAATSQVGGTGTLTMTFQPAFAGTPDDPAIQFLSGPKRAATVTISVGDATAKFGGQASMAFQTGTTAGVILFTLSLPNGTQQSSLTISPAAAGFDSATGVKHAGNLDVSITGFDNTHSASQVAFTFYDKAGATMQPGVIRVDVTADFRLYFASNPAGGAFAMLATFPVSGDATQIASVDVQVTNSAGVAKAQRITFP